MDTHNVILVRLGFQLAPPPPPPLLLCQRSRALPCLLAHALLAECVAVGFGTPRPYLEPYFVSTVSTQTASAAHVSLTLPVPPPHPPASPRPGQLPSHAPWPWRQAEACLGCRT